MSSMKDREEGFERKFAFDEELRFKVFARSLPFEQHFYEPLPEFFPPRRTTLFGEDHPE